jgi:hypothetical protein
VAAALVNLINDLQRGRPLSVWLGLNALVLAVFNMGIWSGGKNTVTRSPAADPPSAPPRDDLEAASNVVRL